MLLTPRCCYLVPLASLRLKGDVVAVIPFTFVIVSGGIFPGQKVSSDRASRTPDLNSAASSPGPQE